MTLHVITPSRGRPGNAVRLRDGLREMSVGPFHLWLGVDNNDHTAHEYLDLLAADTDVTVVVGEPGRLTAVTNRLAGHASADWLAFLGDDHLPRTPGWDKTLIDAIANMAGPGWSYGDDLLMGEKMPTAWVQSAALFRALGWMMLPCCEHLCLDIAVGELGRATDRIAYLPEVVIEHLHPANGKATFDLTYAKANSTEQVSRDADAYYAWLRGEQFTADVATVNAVHWGVPDGRPGNAG